MKESTPVSNVHSKDRSKEFASGDHNRVCYKHFIPGEKGGGGNKAGGAAVHGNWDNDRVTSGGAGGEETIYNTLQPRSAPRAEPTEQVCMTATRTGREKCLFTKNETVSMVDPWQQMNEGRPDKFFRPNFRSWKEGSKGYARTNSTLRIDAVDVSTTPTNPAVVPLAASAEPMRRRASQPAFRGEDACVGGEEQRRREVVDPADIVISSQILESLLQGAEGYASLNRWPNTTTSNAGARDQSTSRLSGAGSTALCTD